MSLSQTHNNNNQKLMIRSNVYESFLFISLLSNNLISNYVHRNKSNIMNYDQERIIFLNMVIKIKDVTNLFNVYGPSNIFN